MSECYKNTKVNYLAYPVLHSCLIIAIESHKYASICMCFWDMDFEGIKVSIKKSRENLESIGKKEVDKSYGYGIVVMYL